MCVREVGKLDPYLRKKGWLWCPILVWGGVWPCRVSSWGRQCFTASGRPSGRRLHGSHLSLETRTLALELDRAGGI